MPSRDGPDFADPPDYKDDITDEDLMPDILSKKPGEDTGMENIIILDGLPQIPPERLEKLKGAVRKTMMNVAKYDGADIISEIYPMDENNISKGFAFYEFKDTDPTIAQRIQKAYNGYKFDKQHTIHVDFFKDFDTFMNIEEEWTEPSVRPFKDIGNLRYWLENEDCFDQYIILSGPVTGTETASVWLNSPVEPVEIQTRPHWTDRFAMWSPLGSYLATFHQKGLALWGGGEFGQISRFPHIDVQGACFSPKERYILTVRPKANHLGVDDKAMQLWDVITSAVKKIFPWEASHPPPANYVKWSPDENFFTTLFRGDCINIFETENFSRISHKVPDVADCSWSPTQNYLAYWVREAMENPARVNLVEVTQGKTAIEAKTVITDLRSKQLFMVNHCEFFWQKNGEYLAVKVHRYKHRKAKAIQTAGNMYDYSGYFYNLEIFALANKKSIPVESLDIKDHIVDLAWEPNGSRLLVITVVEAGSFLVIYNRTGTKFEQTKKMTLRHKAERIAWSPMGQFAVLHTIGGNVGYLTFIDTADCTVLTDVEHFLLTEVLWDPTGRYLTAITQSGNKKDNAYTLYSFQGRFVRTEKVDGLSMFSWRPRPPTLLPETKQKEIKKNLKKYAAEFDAKDKMLANKASREVSERRKRQMDEFMEFLSRKERAFTQAKRKRLDLRRGIDTEALDAHPDELVDERLEIIVGVTTTEIK